VTDDSFTLSLVRKSKRAIRIARLSLQNKDPDSAVNRAYYAMFNSARAALLKSGVAEDELPRTHRGISEAFRQHAVLTGKINADLGSTLSRAEHLRLMADYTAKEIDAGTAGKLVEQAELYVRTVERVFDLQPSRDLESDGQPALARQEQGDHSGGEKGPSELSTGVDEAENSRRRGRENWLKVREQRLESGSPTLEEIRAKGREDWLKLREQRRQGSPSPDDDRTHQDQTADLGRDKQTKDSGKGIDDDLDR
jgi:uncharacterized protein (UPF0332 family)